MMTTVVKGVLTSYELMLAKCNRPNVVGKDEDYCCYRCVNIL
jgi:hypothetical protein